MDTCAYLDKHAMLTFFKAYLAQVLLDVIGGEQLMTYRAAHHQGVIGVVWLFRQRSCHPSSHTVHVQDIMGLNIINM